MKKGTHANAPTSIISKGCTVSVSPTQLVLQLIRCRGAVGLLDHREG